MTASGRSKYPIQPARADAIPTRLPSDGMVHREATCAASCGHDAINLSGLLRAEPLGQQPSAAWGMHGGTQLSVPLSARLFWRRPALCVLLPHSALILSFCCSPAGILNKMQIGRLIANISSSAPTSELATRKVWCFLLSCDCG
jgi:hypothetical protein